MENLIVGAALILLSILIVAFVAIGMGYTVAMMFSIVIDEFKRVLIHSWVKTSNGNGRGEL